MATKTVRAPMPRSRRAKQFMPFDALRGLKEAIAAKERVIEPRRYPSDDAIAEINASLLDLHKGQIITVVYYGIYEQAYLQLTGPVSKIDSYWSNLQIGNTVISFSEIDQLITELPIYFAHSAENSTAASSLRRCCL